MSLARIGAVFQQALRSSAYIAPAATQCPGTGQTVFARFFAARYLDKDKVAERIVAAAKHFEKVDDSKVTTSSTFKELGLDSLDAVELVMAMEEEFAVQIPDDDADKIQSIPSAIEYFSNHPHAR